MTKASQNYINRIALVLDASSSMAYYGLTDQVIKVADSLISYLAKRSVEMDQETRVTVYAFADQAKCLIYDKDVLRLPSIAKVYQPSGNTALIDAAMLSIEDQRLHSQKYGDHAFLTYLLTDGEENRSVRYNVQQLTETLSSNLRDNETFAVLVPNQHGVDQALRYGFPRNNVAVWEVSEKGVTEVGKVLRTATDNYMTARSQGVRKSSDIFSMDLGTVNKATVNAKTLVSLKRDEYTLLKVNDKAPIRDWVIDQGIPYQIGKAFYELTKPEKIQPQKQVAIQNIHSGRVYTGPQVRDLLGLPDYEVPVKPDANPEYRIYVQSTSVNRNLMPNTRLLLLLT